MKLLNIDDLAKPSRAIVIGGYEHQIAEQSVGQLIESVKMAAQATEKDAAYDFEMLVKSVKRLVPTCVEETIRGLTVKQLIAIINFANAPDEKSIQEVAEKKEATMGA